MNGPITKLFFKVYCIASHYYKIKNKIIYTGSILHRSKNFMFVWGAEFLSETAHTTSTPLSLPICQFQDIYTYFIDICLLFTFVYRWANTSAE